MLQSDLDKLSSLLPEHRDKKHVLMYALYGRGYSKSAISRAFDLSQHGSIDYAINKIEGQIDKYPEIEHMVRATAPRIAGIATIKSRYRELHNTIESLLPQVDLIHVYSNDYKGEHTNEKVRFFTGTDKGDWGKFHSVPSNSMYYSCDDDLVYPGGYCDYLASSYNRMPVSLHGRILNTPIKSYYKSGIKFRCLDKVDSDIKVNCIGTGTLCFYSGDFKPPSDMSNGYMADIWFSALCQEERIPLMVLKHEKDYLTYQQVKDTIYDKYKNNDAYQTTIVNKYIKEII